jgi:cell fate (sporulation/competence/biofilm development) regulator YmcA (YheA/YmcA/DUF963 family)
MNIRWIFFCIFLWRFFLFFSPGKLSCQTTMEGSVKRGTFRCACCRRILPRDPRVKNQRYCGAKTCQRARKNKWQREKQKTDPDYRLNKQDSQLAWQSKNPCYWRRYRQKKPDYCERNRRLQQIRNRVKQRPAVTQKHLAKMDTLERIFDDTSMIYLLSAKAGNLAKMDALPVKIIPITAT